MKTQKGSASTVLIVVIVLIIGFAIGYFVRNNKAPVEPISPSNETSNATGTAPVVGKDLAPTGYKTYSNSVLGFSSFVNDKGTVGEVRTSATTRMAIEGKNSAFIYTYGPNPKTNIKTWIVVWHEENGSCLPDMATEGPNFIEPRQNKNNLTVAQRTFGDAAMGQYENLDIHTVSNGKKQYCVVGQLHGLRPYDLEGAAYENKEKLNEAAATEFRTVLKVFVDNFKMI